ncbi:MAG: response regulator [Planctomycetota bacterium]|jgi:twitching motility two-component system response regulator PilH
MAPKKILWVDDDEDLVLSFKPRLEKEGWQVQSATSAEQAKTVVVDDRPDLIIMDIIMEGEHGYSAIEDIMSNPQLASVPVIVFSSLTQRWSETTATREDALLSKAAEFIDKPAEPDVLIRTLHKYLGA